MPKWAANPASGRVASIQHMRWTGRWTDSTVFVHGDPSFQLSHPHQPSQVVIGAKPSPLAMPGTFAAWLIPSVKGGGVGIIAPCWRRAKTLGVRVTLHINISKLDVQSVRNNFLAERRRVIQNTFALLESSCGGNSGNHTIHLS